MEPLSIIILILGACMAVVGLMETTKSRSRSRRGREQDRRGLLLFIIGAMLVMIVIVTQLASK